VMGTETFDTCMAEADLRPRGIHLDLLQPGMIAKGRAPEIGGRAPGREAVVAEEPSRNTVLLRRSPGADAILELELDSER
jgi:hypothetical protein